MTSEAMTSEIAKRRMIAGSLVPLVIAIGLGCKYYRGAGSEVINNFGPASVAYVLLWMLLLFLIVPRVECVWQIAIGVCLGTCLLEFLQLWHPPWLEALRATLLGRLVFGNTFSWWDFPAYFIGCLLGVAVLRGICRKSSPRAQEA